MYIDAGNTSFKTRQDLRRRYYLIQIWQIQKMFQVELQTSARYSNYNVLNKYALGKNT